MNAHGDALLLAPLCNGSLELCVVVLAILFLQEVGAVDVGGVLVEKIAANEAEGEVLEFELEGEVKYVPGSMRWRRAARAGRCSS